MKGYDGTVWFLTDDQLLDQDPEERHAHEIRDAVSGVPPRTCPADTIKQAKLELLDDLERTLVDHLKSVFFSQLRYGLDRLRRSIREGV